MHRAMHALQPRGPIRRSMGLYRVALTRTLEVKFLRSEGKAAMKIAADA